MAKSSGRKGDRESAGLQVPTYGGRAQLDVEVYTGTRTEVNVVDVAPR